MVFGGFSWFLQWFWWFVVVFGFFGGQELETTVKTKKNHQTSILRDSLKIVCVFFVCFLVFTVVLCFFVVGGGFS